jgi:hypothetical protein
MLIAAANAANTAQGYSIDYTTDAPPIFTIYANVPGISQCVTNGVSVAAAKPPKPPLTPPTPVECFSDENNVILYCIDEYGFIVS